MKFHRISAIALISTLGILFVSSTALANGVVIQPIEPPPGPGPWPSQPITLERESYQLNLNDQFMHVKLTQVFRNNTSRDLEGTYIFPLPTNADISDFALWLDGNKLTAETMGSNEARNIYQTIVNSMRDPGLLEYMGDGLIQARIYPIPANGTKQVDIEYDWLLPIDQGLMKISLPLKLDGYSIDTIRQLAISVEIDSPDPLGTIYSPTHDVDVGRHGVNRASVGYEMNNERPTGDFVLYISRPEGAVGLNMLTHSTGRDEGYFLAMIAPEYDESKITVVPKDFALVLDTSGSMSGDKIEQAKDAMKYIFQNLNANDRFSLIAFSTDVYPYFEGWRDASRGNVTDVVDYIDGLDAGGSTNIEAAFSKALDLAAPSDRPFYIVFVSDGLPTVGQTNTAAIIEDISIQNRDSDARIFCFGVGDDVDYPFIDRLAKENNGYTANVAPSQDLEQPLSDFYAKIKSPVMTDIDFEISGVRVYDQIPDRLSDLFLGTQLVIAGRYTGNGRGNVALAGLIGGERVTYNYPVEFTTNRENDFIPRHWATRRVGYLLNQIRLYGENQEVVDEIVQLARRYGIITPYTSMLVTEDEKYPPFPQAPMENRVYGFNGGTGSLGGGGGSARDGFAPPGAAREQSSDLMMMESGEAAPAAPPQEAEGSVRYAGDKTFYMNADGFWEDSEFADSEIEPTEIKYLSQEYYDLIDAEPDIAQYLGVGEKVIVVWNDKAYKVVSNDEDPAEPSAAAPEANNTSDDSKGAPPATGGCGSVGGTIAGGGGSSHVLPLWAFLVFCATASIVIRLSKFAHRPSQSPSVA